MPAVLNGPIPGESLTKEPGNAPWEQPPMIADTQEALVWHLDKLKDPDVIEDLTFLLDQGFPLNVFVESVTTAAVMAGVHSLDVSILIAPVIHEYVKALAEAADVKVVETDGPTKEEKMKERDKQRFMIMLENALADSGGQSEVLEGVATSLDEKGPVASSESLPEAIKGPSPKGFVSKR